MDSRKPKNIPVEETVIDARFECPICLLCLKDPVVTFCGHRFCNACIKEWLKKNNARCPVDNEPLQEKDIFPDNYTRREIQCVTTLCTVCDKEYSLSLIDDHMASHSNSKCYFHDLGCDFEIQEGKLKEHMETEIHFHMRLLHSMATKFDPKAEEAAMWETGKESEKSNSLIRVLYEKVVTLEQKTREQDCIVHKQNRQILTLEKQMEDISLRHCFGDFLWKIENFREKIEELRVNEGYHFSPGFYTSPTGYKLCARINVANHNPDYLSILLHLMHSENDIALPWPFTGHIRLVVLHPTQQKKSIIDTLSADPGLEAFLRPTREINAKAYGFPEYAPIAALLENDEFLDDGTLVIKILVQTG